MKQFIVIPTICVALAGCSDMGLDNLMPRPPHLQSQPSYDRNLPPPPRDDAITVDELDTATDDDRMAAATTPPNTAAGSLGVTVASLGDPTAPGFWLETSLVSSESSGRVQSKATGRTVKVTLRPSSGGGSRVSLSTLQLLDLDISGLHELVVFGS
ncbi:D-galactarate dehydratase [Aliiroseovarius sediminis]|uniref:D-galactarate dehydratase n=1 Tax=Aliiroseovarius sediminis TaxID=2925839 RepID=UPI001F5A74ED|nr:D-galactarate dehydratase [Aliiroseovarius sediminis]MCI2393004.1 D-galactarate dehydratase [Aliiroseovarius sediminis]